MVDLRYELKRLLEDEGSNAILLRNDRTKTCKCVDKITLAPKDTCQICLGTGYINSGEKLKVRTKVTSAQDTLPKSVSLKEIGNVGVSLRQFYLEYTVRPKAKDLLVICEWEDGKPVFDEYTEIYEVENAEPLRGEGGRIEYFILVAQSDPVNMQLKLNSIKQNAGKLTYYIATKR